MKTRVILFALLVMLFGDCLAQVDVIEPFYADRKRDTLIAPTANVWHTVTLTGTGWEEFIIFSSNNTAASFEVAFGDTTKKVTVAPGSIYKDRYKGASAVNIRSNGSATATFIINSYRRMGF